MIPRSPFSGMNLNLPLYSGKITACFGKPFRFDMKSRHSARCHTREPIIKKPLLSRNWRKAGIRRNTTRTPIGKRKKTNTNSMSHNLYLVGGSTCVPRVIFLTPYDGKDDIVESAIYIGYNSVSCLELL